MVNVMKAAKATGFAEKVPMFIHTATELSVVMPLGDQGPEGVMGTSNYLFYYPETPENKAFAEKFKAKYDRYPKIGALYGYLAAQYIAQGYAKAGEFDTEKFIDAVEGLTVDSPVGPVEMRACDHQTVLPMIFGLTKFTPEYPFLVSTDNVMIPGPETMPSCEEVSKTRAK